MKRKFFFTFGVDQEHDGCYVEVEAESSLDAREVMFEHYGREWAFEYDSAEEAGVFEYGLKEIKIDGRTP